MRAVKLNSAFSSLIAAMILMASLLMAPGCGESNYSDTGNDTDTSVSKTGQYEGYVREHWSTDSELLFDGLEVTYSPLVEGSGGDQKRSGDRNSITVSLSLVEYNEDIRAYGTIILDAEASLTSHPMELFFGKCHVVAGYEGITVTGSGTLTTKTESGNLIQPTCPFTLDIVKTSQNIYRCHARIEIEKGLYKVAEFKIPIFRTGNDDPISFYESTWGKKQRVFEIRYPKKQYTSQMPVTTLADEDILKLNIGETEPETENDTKTDPIVLAGSEFHLPANLSPNGEPITIDLTDESVLSNLDYMVEVEKTGTLDTVDMEGNPLLGTNFRLSLNISKKIVLVAQDQVDCETACKEECAADYIGEQLKTCQDRCENRTCVVREEQYMMMASLEIDGLDMRTSMAEVVERVEGSGQDNDGDGFFDNFKDAELLLKAGETYSVTHAITEGAIDDTFEVSYDKVSIDMDVSTTEPGAGVMVGKLLLPALVSPQGLPKMTLILGEKEANLDVHSLASDYSSFEIGQSNPDDPNDTSGWVPTKISKHYPEYDGDLSPEGLLHLTVRTLDNGAQECMIEFKTLDNWLSIEIAGMEVEITAPATDTEPKVKFELVKSPRQGVTVHSLPECDDKNQDLYESEVDVYVTVAKLWDGVAETVVVKSGRVEVNNDLDCLGIVVEEVPADTWVNMEDVGFDLDATTVKTLNEGEENEESLTKTVAISLFQSDNGFDFVVNFTPFHPVDAVDFDDVVKFVLPAHRLGGTGVFISNPVE